MNENETTVISNQYYDGTKLLSMKDLNASPYCLFNFSASSSLIFKTREMSLVMLSPS